MTDTEGEGTVNNNILQFIGAQNQRNEEIRSFMEKYAEDKNARDKQ